jgi:hypothetical protein
MQVSQNESSRHPHSPMRMVLVSRVYVYSFDMPDLFKRHLCTYMEEFFKVWPEVSAHCVGTDPLFTILLHYYLSGGLHDIFISRV